MKIFDSEEAKEFSKKMQEYINHIHKHRPSKEDMEEVEEQIERLAEIAGVLSEKLKLGTITGEEKDSLISINDFLHDLFQKLNKTQAALHHHLFGVSGAFMQHMKELAEKGDKKAKEIYKDLLKSYRDAIKEQTDDEESKN
ncbi:MAG: hypothetical protein HY958_05950 [Bacteroidia bacterium]|nr:hypothetical protein [Bacteroidia bacterium]